MKTARELIESIKVDRSNLEHIASTGVINGSLLVSILDIMTNHGHSQYKKGYDEGNLDANPAYMNGDEGK